MKVRVLKDFGKKVTGQTLEVTEEIGKNLISKKLVEDVNNPKPKRGRKPKTD